MKTVLVPLPDNDFDVTEVAIPWQQITQAGHSVVFATESGHNTPAADPRLLSGVIFGQLGAAPDAIAAYRAMEQSEAFQKPVSWKGVSHHSFDGLLLPGGHAPGMRPYLESVSLQRLVADVWSTERPVAAICHGTIVLARTRDHTTGRSVLYGHRTTCLPGYMEALAYALTGWKLGRYYRTYPAYVESEVRTVLQDPDRDFVRGPITLGKRGTASDASAAFCVEDGRYVSARWPGDAYLFAERFLQRLER